MFRAMILAAVAVLIPCTLFAQTQSVLHIKVVLVDADRTLTPVARHRLLISDNPATAAPRLIVTGLDGTADVKLRPGNYTVESDRPVAFHGKAYQWTQNVDVAADRDAVLELNAGNAEAAAVADAADTPDRPLESDPEIVLPKWQDSVVALWTPTLRASGFVIDAKGLIATNQRVIGTATTVEVQLAASVKVMASVVVADRVRDVAVLWIDPTVIAGVPPVPLRCQPVVKPSIKSGEKIFTIGSGLRQMKDLMSGTVSRVDPRRIVSDFLLASGGAGGPVFSADGNVVGITSVVDEREANVRGAETPITPASEVCEVVASAQAKMATAVPPTATRLPVEPGWALPEDAFKDAAQHRAGSLSPYQQSSSAFEIAFVTPLITYGVQHQADQVRRARTAGARTRGAGQVLVPPSLDFGNWAEYVETFPPVLLVRVTPKQTEGFWTTVARGAAQTQGMSIPPIKRFNGSFARMRVYCGDAEVTPVHPFKIERRISDTDTIDEGLYAFDPGALGPHCGTVKLSMYSDKEPDKEDARVVDARVVQQIWQDFEPYRALNKP